jgi:hypothetical protein
MENRRFQKVDICIYRLKTIQNGLTLRRPCLFCDPKSGPFTALKYKKMPSSSIEGFRVCSHHRNEMLC